MNQKILVFSVMAAPGLALSAFTVDDLVVDNGIHAIETLYWGKMDQGLDLNTGVCDYAESPYGGGKGVHFEYVRNVNEEILPTFVKLVGFRGFTGAQSCADCDFVFTIADDNNNPVADGTRLILPNDAYWAHDESTMQMSIINYESCVSRDGRYMLGALGRQDTEWWLEMYDLYVPPYIYWSKSGRYYRHTKNEWVGHMSLNAEGNVVVSFSDPAIFFRTGYYAGGKGGSGADEGIPVSLSTNQIQMGIIDRLTIETYRPSGFFKVTEYPFSIDGYLTGAASVKTYTVPYKMTANDDGTFSIVNITGTGYARSADDDARIIPVELTGRIENGSFILTGGQPFDIWHSNSVVGEGERGNDAVELLAGLPKFPARNFSYGDVTGTISTEASLSHTSDVNYWVNPGACRTVVRGASIKIGPFAGVHNSGAHSTSAYAIESEGGAAETDVTLDCAIVSCVCSYDDKTRLKDVDCRFAVYKNDAYVESYAIYMIPKYRVTGTPADHEDFQGEGHAHAIYVGSVDASDNMQTSYPKEYEVSATVDLNGRDADPTNDYYFFIAANYKADISPAALRGVSRASSRLHPTYHSLFSPDQVTGIGQITAPSDLPAEYYDIYGRKVTAPGHGIYIRRQGQSVTKIGL